MADWTIFSNYGHVLVCLARNNEARLRDVATDVGITERAVQKIVHDLQVEGFITIAKHGRRNRYRINSRKRLRHALESQCSIGKLLVLLKKPGEISGDKPETDKEPEPIQAPEAILEETPAAGSLDKPPAELERSAAEPDAESVGGSEPEDDRSGEIADIEPPETDEKPPNTRLQQSLF